MQDAFSVSAIKAIGRYTTFFNGITVEIKFQYFLMILEQSSPSSTRLLPRSAVPNKDMHFPATFNTWSVVLLAAAMVTRTAATYHDPTALSPITVSILIGFWSGWLSADTIGLWVLPGRVVVLDVLFVPSVLAPAVRAFQLSMYSGVCYQCF